MESQNAPLRIQALAVLLVLAGCDNAIETPSSLNTYTLWGALDPTSDVQSVRVIRVADTLVARTAAPLPVTVASVDLSTGTETPWRDSVVTFRDQSIGHVYHAAFRPDYGGRYRIIVRRDAGSDVTAETTVPPAVTPMILPTDINLGVRAPILWSGAPQLSRLNVTYFVQKYDRGNRPGIEPAQAVCVLDTISFRLDPDPGQVGSDWRTHVDYVRSRQILEDALEGLLPLSAPLPPGETRPPHYRIGLRKVRVSANVLTERPPAEAGGFGSG